MRPLVIALVLVISVLAVAQVPPPPPPPGLPEPPPPLKILRLELQGSLLQPQGALANKLDTQDALGFMIGVNINETLAWEIGFRAALVGGDKAGKDFYYLDLISTGLRVQLEVAPRIALFGAGDLSLTGVSVPCTSDIATCGTGSGSGSDTSFQPRLGVHLRAGGTIALVPRQVELFAALGDTLTLPDEGGWFAVMAGIIFQVGELPPQGPGVPPPMMRAK